MSASAQVRLLLIVGLLSSLSASGSAGAEKKKGQPGVVVVDTKFWQQGQSVDEPPSGTFGKGTKVEVVSEFRDGETVYKFVRILEPRAGQAKSGWVKANEVTIVADQGAHFLPAVSDKMNDIGFQGLRFAAGSERKNALISPYGIWANLVVLQQGAKGESAREIERLVGEPEEGLPRSFHSTEFKSIDCLVKRPGLELTDSFAGFAGVRGMEVRESAFDEVARRSFNDWVKEQSNSLIPEFFSAGSWNKEAQALVANVAYFQGDWQSPFTKDQTLPDRFQLTPKETIQVDMMSARRQFVSFGSNRWNADGVILPYKEGEIAAVVIVPREVEGLAALLVKLKGGAFREEFAEMPRDIKAVKTTDVTLILPKLDIAAESPVDKILELKSLTSNAADLSGIFASGKVKLSQIIQKARLKVDEKGTEAAAATVSVAVPSAINLDTPKIVSADRPFLFCITHWPSRSILFCSAVYDPRPMTALK